MSIISNEEIRKRIAVNIPITRPYDKCKIQKMQNIASFIDLSRNGLTNGSLERRILLYETLRGEKLFYQYPGKESRREGNKNFPFDAKPMLVKSNGDIAADMDFKKIWDIIDKMGNDHKADMDILGTIFLRIAYMIEYRNNDNIYNYSDVDLLTGNIEGNGTVPLKWNSLCLDSDILETLNDKFNLNEMSLEAFLYYNDILAQNEDIKYYYLKGNDENQVLKNGNGRINNCLSHLTVISHIRGYIGISKLIDSFQRTGVAPLPQSRFEEACGNLVKRV